MVNPIVLQRACAAPLANCQIVPGSTPVVSFGNPDTSSVATLGINPSHREFLQGKNKPLLTSGKKRLVDYDDLGISVPRALTPQEGERVVAGCNVYFRNNPYKWFEQLQNFVLSPTGNSYYDTSGGGEAGGETNATACHLDLVQWATDPVWSQFDKNSPARAQLLANDQKFLLYQLTYYNFKYLFLNGKTVLENFHHLGLTPLSEAGSIRRTKAGDSSKIYTGTYQNTTVIGWGINIGYGSTFTGGKEDLSRWLAQNVN